jgi:hypothetical protein
MRKLILLIMSLSLFATNSFSQPWQRVAEFGMREPLFIYNDSINNSLLITGKFLLVNDSAYNGLASYNNGAFSNFGCGIQWDCISPLSPNGVVFGYEMINYNNKIYATGSFTKIGNIPTNSFGEWDGQYWQVNGQGLKYGNNEGYGAMFSLIDNELYIGGGFDTAFGVAANSLIKFDGQTWSTVYNLPKYNVSGNFIGRVTKFQNKIYVSGQFYSGFPVPDINALVVFDGTNWVSVGTGFPNPNDALSDMVVYKNELIVGGHFTKNTSSLNPGNNIAAWDGTNWHSLGDASQGFGVNGVNASVVRMIVHGDYLYVCGHFSEAGNQTATNIARWDGTNWCSLATGFSSAITNEAVTSLAFYGDTLFAVGNFSQYNGDTTIRYAAKLPNPDSYVTNCTTVNIVEYAQQNNFEIFPNPTNQILNIKTKTNFINTTICDLQGRIIINQSFMPSIDLSTLKNGMYILELSNHKQKTRQRFIKY